MIASNDYLGDDPPIFSMLRCTATTSHRILHLHFSLAAKISKRFYIFTDRIQGMGEGNVFTGVCHSVHSLPLHADHPSRQTPPPCKPPPCKPPQIFRQTPLDI